MTSYTFAKARSHPVERYATALGLVLMGLIAGAAGTLMGLPGVVAGVASTVIALAVMLHPGDRLSYSLGAHVLQVGDLTLPLREIADVRIVQLGGTFVYAGLTLPGYWVGRAWSSRLGRFTLMGSTGLGQGVLITMRDGRRIAITPERPVSMVVTLQVMLRSRAVRHLRTV